MTPLHAELIAGAYPANRDSTIVLRDGSTLAVRPIKPEDEVGLAHFFSSLSVESRILRFFAPVANAHATAKRLVQVDYKSRQGLVAEAGAQGEIIAHAMYVEIGPRKAPDGVREGLAAFLPAAGSTSNPAHMLAAAGSPGVIVISHW